MLKEVRQYVKQQTPIISLFLLILSLESFIPSIALNLSVVAFCILFYALYRRFKMLAWMILLAILPSLANYWAVQLHENALSSHARNEGLPLQLYRPCLCSSFIKSFSCTWLKRGYHALRLSLIVVLIPFLSFSKKSSPSKKLAYCVVQNCMFGRP